MSFLKDREEAPRPRAVRIGITGPIGCGKSTIARWLGERPGVVVIDADRVARDVLEPGEPALDAVVARFGPSFLHGDGSLDRAALGRLVFADPTALRDLEAIVHPAVRPRIIAAIGEADRSGAAAVIVEAIKLLEGGLADQCDDVWLVTCDPAIQRERLIGRGMPAADAAQRLDAQGDLRRRAGRLATRSIDTSASRSEVRRFVEAALSTALEEHRLDRA